MIVMRQLIYLFLIKRPQISVNIFHHVECLINKNIVCFLMMYRKPVMHLSNYFQINSYGC